MAPFETPSASITFFSRFDMKVKLAGGSFVLRLPMARGRTFVVVGGWTRARIDRSEPRLLVGSILA